MDDLISRTTAIARIDKCVALSGIGLEPVMAVRDVKALISMLLAVDAALVVHGKWIDIPDKPEWDQKMCSVCGDYFCCQNNYCPNCGAKMETKNE